MYGQVVERGGGYNIIFHIIFHMRTDSYIRVSDLSIYQTAGVNKCLTQYVKWCAWSVHIIHFLSVCLFALYRVYYSIHTQTLCKQSDS